MKRGKLIFRYGTMNSGKSLQLLAMAHNLDERDIPCILLKSVIDTRDGEGVIHSRALGDKECCMISPSTDIYDFVMNNFLGWERHIIKWVLVDEAQFLTEKQVDELAALCDIKGTNVVCYGLRTDFKTNLFPGSKRLFEIADSFEEIKSTCSCGCKTIVNARKNKDGKIVTDGEQIEVGGEDKYVSLCRLCYSLMTNKEHYV